MQPAVERRADRVARMDFDAVVELRHGDFAVPFEADALDLGPGGIALQAPYLPEVGTHLDCRFDLPGTGQDVAVSGEVVWAASRGPDAGRFGLRFQHLPDEVRERIRRCLGDEPAADASVADDGDEVRLELDGVASPIVARPVHRAPDLLVVEQPLPFLSLGRGVRVGDDGRGARLDSVDLVQGAGDVPRLVLTLTWTEEALATLDEPPEEPVAAARDDLEAFVQEDFADGTYPGAVGPESDGLTDDPWAADRSAYLDGPADGDPTEQDLAPPSLGLPTRGAHRRAPRLDTADPAGVAALAPLPTDAPVSHGPRRVLRDDSGAEWEVPVPGGSHRRRALADTAREAVASAGRRTRAALAGALPPVLRAGRQAGVLGRRAVRAVTGAVTRPAPADPAGTRRHGPRGAAAKTRPASDRRNVRTPSAGAPTVALDRRRLALGAALAVAAGAIAFVLFGGGASTEVPADPSAARPPVDDAPYAPSLAELGLEPSGDAAAVDAAPTDAEAAAPPAPDAVPSDSPYAVDLQELVESPSPEPAVFGDPHVPNGQSFLLRMSQPVRSLEGRVEDDGFSVTMRGTLALQGAAPIAAAHPAVERALILNRGSYSVLTIRFADGKRPKYRVVARNQALEIEIGS